MFRSLFSRKPTKNIPEISNLTIDRAFHIDPVEMKLVGKDSIFVSPEIDLRIVAQGYSDLGEQSFLHRFYPDDDRFILQIQGGDGVSDKRIDEIVLWYAFDVRYISQDDEWSGMKQKMSAAQFSLPTQDGAIVFQRVWFNHSDAAEDPMTYFEDVHENRESQKGRSVFQTAMLFGRGLKDGSDEMLLVNMEEPEDGDRAVSYLVGRAIPMHSLVT
ncbi:DUF2491 family protein [uncultured Tateyamaria sp.]|uniref:DUF2491 family protein n=1 Tax=uncultured Tateyamaria sp. TaxID=455651 RepID=UPI00260E2305|nr:DUF2491 family protein [uncultured Tateyamaria sp.]